MRDKLGCWLESLDPDAVAEEVDAHGYEALPKLRHEDEQWKVTFTAIPRAPEKRDTPAEAIIGVLGAQVRWLNTWQKLRDSLLAKAKRYGKLDHPLIIAVNAIALHLDRIDAIQALFGQEQYVFQKENPTTEPRMERAPTGFWYGPRGVRYSRVCGVILGYDLEPWTYGARDLTFYINPWSDSVVRGNLTTLPTASASKEKIEWKDGVHPADVLQLLQEYPGRGRA